METLALAQQLNGNFFDAHTLFELGKHLQAEGLHGLAAVVESAAIDVRFATGEPFPEAQLVLGLCYKAAGNREMAERIWKDALRMETLPAGRADLLHNLSGICLNDGRPKMALRYADDALLECPTHAGARANRGLACLEMGRWAEGWDGFAACYDTGDRQRRVYGNTPEWDGSTAKTVIVYGDQGLGDEIMFANCLPDMIRDNNVILDCHPRLLTLFTRSFPEARVHGTRKRPVSELYWEHAVDASIGLADLPRFYRRCAADWKGGAYLKASQGRDRGKRPERIGFAWGGGSKATRGDLRSIPLEMLEPIFAELKGRELISLDYRPEAEKEIERFWKKAGIDLKHDKDTLLAYDYDRTAALVASLDLVITVCTTIHHLAGALGVPCWTLVPRTPSWRYGVKGDRVPWYDSVKLFRQEVTGDWGPIERICEELRRI